MARAVRPVKAKRKKIRVYKKEEHGDIRISGGVAKIRLTPKVILLFSLMVVASVAIVIVAARQGRKQSMTIPPAARTQESGVATAPTVTPGAEAAGPVIGSVELSPQPATVGAPIELKYTMTSAAEGETAYSVRWFMNESPVQEGPSTTLDPAKFRKGAAVYAEFTATDGAGRSVTLATSPVTVANTPPQLSTVAIEPKQPQRGADLTATASATDADNDAVTCSYQWLVNGAPAGAEGPQKTFSTANLRKQDVVSVSAVCSDGQDATQPVVSSPVSIGGNNNPEILSSAPDSVVNGVYTYQVAAKDPDGDTLQYRMERGPAGMTIDPASGLIQWTVPKGVMYTGRNEVQAKFTVDDGNGGTVSQEFVIVLVDYVNY